MRRLSLLLKTLERLLKAVLLVLYEEESKSAKTAVA
jgi:hypothetical protein